MKIQKDKENLSEHYINYAKKKRGNKNERNYKNQSRTSMGPIFMHKFNKKKGRLK